MISTSKVKIKIINDLSSDYIETELKKLNFDVLRWAIVDKDDSFYYLNVSYVD